jgi:hypothetical protein
MIHQSYWSRVARHTSVSTHVDHYSVVRLIRDGPAGGGEHFISGLLSHELGISELGDSRGNAGVAV